MIDNKNVNVLFKVIFIVEVITIVLGFIIGTSFYFCLKPFIYICLAIFTCLFVDKKYVVKQLKKYVNQKIVKTASANIRLLEKVRAVYQSNDYGDVLDILPPSYKMANTEIYKNKMSTQNKLLYSPQTHIHKTISGVFVRSKSEAIIADTLTSYGIPFSYEEQFPGLTKDGKKLYPDFKIKCSDGWIIIWEHWGLLTKLNYCIDQAYKLNVYHNQGYNIGQNLIITADDNHGGCSAQQIDQIVRTLILPHMGN